jgi:hypothetical protein
MKTCIFICKKRHACFNLDRIYDKNKHRFVCIVSKENYHNLSENNKLFFNEIILVSNISENEINPIIQKEIAIVGNTDNISLLCLDELDILTVAHIRELFNLKGGKVSDYLPFRNKITMKEILHKNNIRVPNFISFEKIGSLEPREIYEKIFESLKSEFIIKPILGASSIDTIKIESYDKFLQWHNSVGSLMHDYEAEEFITGKLYHCDSFVKNGKIIFSEVSECLSNCLDYAKGMTSDGSIVLPEHDILRNNIIEFNNNVIRVLNPPDGPLHHELFVKTDGEIVFLEIAARPGGGEIVSVLEKNFGFNLYEQALRNELNEEINSTFQKDLYHCWVYLLLPEGKIKNLHTPKLKSNFQIEWNVAIGDTLSASKISLLRPKAALISLNHSDFDVIYDDFNFLKTFNAVEVEVE